MDGNFFFKENPSCGMGIRPSELFISNAFEKSRYMAMVRHCRHEVHIELLHCRHENVASNLDRNIRHSNISPLNFLGARVENSFFCVIILSVKGVYIYIKGIHIKCVYIHMKGVYIRMKGVYIHMKGLYLHKSKKKTANTFKCNNS